MLIIFFCFCKFKYASDIITWLIISIKYEQSSCFSLILRNQTFAPKNPIRFGRTGPNPTQ